MKNPTKTTIDNRLTQEPPVNGQQHKEASGTGGAINWPHVGCLFVIAAFWGLLIWFGFFA